MAYGTFSPSLIGGPRPITADEQYHLRNDNPFARVTSLIGSPPTQVAPTFGDLGRGLSWQDLELQRILHPNPGSQGLAGFAGPTPSNFLPSNPFSTLRNVKNPDVQSAIDSLLGQVKALPTDINVNPNVVRANVKDAPTAARIDSAGARFNADVNNSRQSFADFTKNYMAGLAEAQKQLGTESGSLDTVYDTGPNGLQAQLAAMANARRLAVTSAAQRAMRTAGAGANSARVLGGDSSYLDAQLLDQLGGIGSQAAKEKADLDRLNLLSVVDARSRLLGTRGNALTNLLHQGLVPLQAQQQLAGNELAQLSGLSNLQNQNTFYNLDSPEAMLARRLGLVGQTSQVDLANNFYGLQRPYQPDASGSFPIRRPNLGAPPQYDPYSDYGGDQFSYPQPRLPALPMAPTMDIARTPNFLQRPSPNLANQWLPDDFYESPESYGPLVQQQNRLFQQRPDWFYNTG